MVKVGLCWDEFRMVKVPDALENQPPPLWREAIGEWSTELAPPRACENATSRRHEVTTADVTDE